MSILRSTLLADAREFADATGSTRWLDPLVLRVADLVFRREWSGILNANKMYRAAVRTPALTLDSTLGRGSFDLSALNSGAGDTLQTFYRIIAVRADRMTYQLDALDRIPGAMTTINSLALASPAYWVVGTTVSLSPARASTAPSVLVNYTPVAPSLLADSASTVEFPAGYESILSMELGALLLAKGGAETQASRDLKFLADEARGDMLADVARFTTNPNTVQHGDTASEWGC